MLLFCLDNGVHFNNPNFDAKNIKSKETSKSLIPYNSKHINLRLDNFLYKAKNQLEKIYPFGAEMLKKESQIISNAINKNEIEFLNDEHKCAYRYQGYLAFLGILKSELLHRTNDYFPDKSEEMNEETNIHKNVFCNADDEIREQLLWMMKLLKERFLLVNKDADIENPKIGTRHPKQIAVLKKMKIIPDDYDESKAESNVAFNFELCEPNEEKGIPSIFKQKELLQKLKIEGVIGFIEGIEIRTVSEDYGHKKRLASKKILSLDQDYKSDLKNIDLSKVDEIRPFYLVFLKSKNYKDYLNKLIGEESNIYSSVSQKSKQNQFSDKIPLGTKWYQIKIEFHDDYNRIKIYLDNRLIDDFSYVDLGMVDHNKPDRLWSFLVKFADEYENSISYPRSVPIKDKRDKADLKKLLQNLFGIKDEPFPFSYKEKAYKSKIKLLPS